MERRALEGLQRDELISRAREASIERAEVLTRDELIDELLRHAPATTSSRARARGFFGRARDLIATVLEKGLHLPEAAERVRVHAPARDDDSQPAALATVTLAEIYAAQGHIERATAVLDEVLEREPDHAAAKKLRARLLENPAGEVGSITSSPGGALTTGSSGAATPKASGAAAEGPIPMLDDSPLPERYDVDEAVVMPVDPTTAYVYWEVRGDTLARLQALAPGGHASVRVFASGRTATGDAYVDVRDIRADARVGDYFVYDLPQASELRVALGWLAPSGSFEQVAAGPTYSTPPGGPSLVAADTVARWSVDSMTIVTPSVSALRGDPQAANDAPEALTTHVANINGPATAPAWLPRAEGFRWVRAFDPLGSSEHWVHEPLASAPTGSSDATSSWSSGPSV